MRVIYYRQCLDCKHVDYDHTFEDYTITEQEVNTANVEIKSKCPACDSANVSGNYYDQELTKPCLPLQYDTYDASEIVGD